MRTLAVAALALLALAALHSPAQAQWLCGTNDDPHGRPESGSSTRLEKCGVRAVLVRDSEVPLVSFHVRVPGGSFADSPAEAGRAGLLAEWLRRGARGRSAEEFQRAVESIGGSLSISAEPRWIAIDAEFLVDDAATGIQLVADVILHPNFDPNELRKAVDLARAKLTQLRTEPSDAIGTYWNAFVFGPLPSGNPGGGDEASLASAVQDPKALAELWGERTSGFDLWLGIAGDADAELLDEVHAAFAERLGDRIEGGDLRVRAPLPTPGHVARPPIQPGRALLVDHPEALQTYFRFGGPGFDRTDPDHAARYLANTILGGRFTSRLNTALRIEAGLTYGARSSFDDERGGTFVVSTYTETATSKECIDLARKVYRDFVATGMTDAELGSAKAYVKGQFAPDELETPAQRAAWALDLAISGMNWSFIKGFFERLDAVTLDEVNRVITTRFPRDGLCWVLIGQADVLRPIAEELGEVTEVKLSDPGFGPRR